MVTRGKNVVLWCTGVTIVLLAVTATVGRHRILEEYHLLRLRSESESLWRSSFDYLTESGSARAIPRIFEIMKYDVERDSLIFSEHMGVCLIIERNRGGALRVLEQLAESENRVTRGLAVMYLGQVGPTAVPALTDALQDRDTRVRQAAVESLAASPPGCVSSSEAPRRRRSRSAAGTSWR